MNKWKSRKLWAAIGAVVVALLVDVLGVDIDEDTLQLMVGTVIAYILGQSWVDAHK